MKSFEKCLHRSARATITGLTVLVIVCLAGSFAVAQIGEGPTLAQYSVISVGSTASINVNSGPILGTVLVGAGTTVTSAGGGNGQITGGVDNSGAGSGCGATGLTCFSSLNRPPMVRLVSSSVGTDAFSEAAALSAQASALGLNPTQTFGNLTGTQTITGNGGLNVINITGEKNAKLTISGGPNDIFVFNVSGSIATNQPITLQGVTAGQILWNLTGSGTVLQTSGGNSLVGTFLATKPGQDFQFSSLNLNGQLINTGGHIQWVSNSRMLAFTPFLRETQEVIPEPSSLLLFGTGLIAGAGILRRKASARLRQCAVKVFGVEPIQIPQFAP